MGLIFPGQPFFPFSSAWGFELKLQEEEEEKKHGSDEDAEDFEIFKELQNI